jgi:hypothetical protein
MIWALYFEHHVNATDDNKWVTSDIFTNEVARLSTIDKNINDDMYELNAALLWRDTWLREMKSRARLAYQSSAIKKPDESTPLVERRWKK